MFLYVCLQYQPISVTKVVKVSHLNIKNLISSHNIYTLIESPGKQNHKLLKSIKLNEFLCFHLCRTIKR